MSNRNDRSQGLKPDPARPQSRPTPAPVTAGQVKREVQAGINAAAARDTKQRPAQRVSDPQDWRRG